MTKKQCLTILEIKNANPSNKQIRKAYRKLSLKYHPDTKNGDENKFKKIRDAYERLTKNTYTKNTTRSNNNNFGFSNSTINYINKTYVLKVNLFDFFEKSGIRFKPNINGSNMNLIIPSSKKVELKTIMTATFPHLNSHVRFIIHFDISEKPYKGFNIGKAYYQGQLTYVTYRTKNLKVKKLLFRSDATSIKKEMKNNPIKNHEGLTLDKYDELLTEKGITFLVFYKKGFPVASNMLSINEYVSHRQDGYDGNRMFSHLLIRVDWV
jgi:hypothetical protein